MKNITQQLKNILDLSLPFKVAPLRQSITCGGGTLFAYVYTILKQATENMSFVINFLPAPVLWAAAAVHVEGVCD